MNFAFSENAIGPLFIVQSFTICQRVFEKLWALLTHTYQCLSKPSFQNSKGVPNSERCSGNKTTISIESYFVLSEVTEGYCLSVFAIISLFTLDTAQKRLGTRSMQCKDGWSYSFLFSQVQCPTTHFYFKKTKEMPGL